MKTEVLLLALACSIGIAAGSQDMCNMPDGYGQEESTAIKSLTADSLEKCEIQAFKGKSDWISYDDNRKECKLYGKANITSGITNNATIPHYSTSACRLNGCGVSQEYQDCLKFSNNVPPIKTNPYSGFTCRKGPYGYTGGSGHSGVYLRKTGQPITKITLTTWSHWVTNAILLKINYGPDKESSHGVGGPNQRLGPFVIEPAEGDCINKIEVRIAKRRLGSEMLDDILSLAFHTLDGKKFGPYGATGGTLHEAKAPKGSCLSFVDIWSGGWVNGMAFTFEPLSAFFA